MPKRSKMNGQTGTAWKNKLRRIAGMVGLVLGCLGLGWGVYPLEQKENVLKFNADQMRPPGFETQTPQTGWRLVLTYPSRIRAGDPSEARIVFEPEEKVETDAQPGGTMDQIFVETRMELPGIWVEPEGTSGQALPLDRAVTFWWQLTGVEQGEYQGTAWLSLRKGSFTSQESQAKALAAPRIRIQVQRFLGLSGTAVRWLGGALILVGFILFIAR